MVGCCRRCQEPKLWDRGLHLVIQSTCQQIWALQIGPSISMSFPPSGKLHSDPKVLPDHLSQTPLFILPGSRGKQAGSLYPTSRFGESSYQGLGCPF